MGSETRQTCCCFRRKTTASTDGLPHKTQTNAGRLGWKQQSELNRLPRFTPHGPSPKSIENWATAPYGARLTDASDSVFNNNVVAASCVCTDAQDDGHETPMQPITMLRNALGKAGGGREWRAGPNT